MSYISQIFLSQTQHLKHLFAHSSVDQQFGLGSADTIHLWSTCCCSDPIMCQLADNSLIGMSCGCLSTASSKKSNWSYVTHHPASKPELIHIVVVTGLPRAAREGPVCYIFEGSTCITCANVPLAEQAQIQVVEKLIPPLEGSCCSHITKGHAYRKRKNSGPFLQTIYQKSQTQRTQKKYHVTFCKAL